MAALVDLVALTAVRTTGETYSLKKEIPPTGFPSKYLALHALTWHPSPSLDVRAVQGTLFGGRISVYSLLPTAFITEPFTGNHDNAFAGLSLGAALPWRLHMHLDVYVDDYQFIDPIAGFNPSPFANKTAGTAGLSWAPLTLPLRASLDYTFVAPYMYTHSSHAALNYLTYTHRGRALGSALPPNSDRWQIELASWPTTWLDLVATARYIRHGNGSDHGSGSVDGDGSIWDDGYGSTGGVTFYGEATFLNQSVLEGTLQLQLEAHASVQLGQLRARGGLWYGIEHVTNPLLDGSADPMLAHLLGVTLEVGY